MFDGIDDEVDDGDGQRGKETGHEYLYHIFGARVPNHKVVGLENFEEDEPQDENQDGSINPVRIVHVGGQFEVGPDYQGQEHGKSHRQQIQRHDQPCRCNMQVSDSQI